MGRPSAREVIVALVKAIVAVAIAIALLAVAGFVLLINTSPFFKPPETGRLQADLTRDIRLEPGQRAAAFELDVRVSAESFRTSGRDPEPPSLEVAVRPATGEAVATLAGLRLRLAPVDAPVGDIRRSPGEPRVEWSMACPEREYNKPCVATYLLLVEAEPTAEARSFPSRRARRDQLPHLGSHAIGSVDGSRGFAGRPA